MNRRCFVGLLGALPAVPLGWTAASAAPVQTALPSLADVDYTELTMSTSAYLNALFVCVWKHVCHIPGLLPIEPPINEAGQPVAFSAPDIHSVADYSKCPDNCTKKHAPLYWSRNSTEPYVLELRRCLSDKRILDIDEVRARPWLLADWVHKTAVGMASEMRRTIYYSTDVTYVRTGIHIPKLSTIVAEIPKVFVKREAHFLEMFAYTMFGVPTTVAQLRAEYNETY